MNAADEGLEVGAVLDIGAGQRQRPMGAAVEAPAKRDERGSVGRDLRQLHGCFDRLGPGIGQEEAVVDAGLRVGKALRQAPVQLEPGLVVDDVLLEVNATRGLLADGRHNPRVSVAGVGDADSARVVEVAGPIDRLDPGAGGPLHHEVGVARPDRWNARAQRGPIGQKVGGVLIHSNRVSPPASFRQLCGSVDGKLSASPARVSW